ncbi:ABC-F family ATP-binding cassette domain-containing protein [Streptomyces omiyaensis]|uniref:ABC-F family ATP-binding cassette domain-containing protein n=1 Tax=Streptomyces omiyaensis TaxID=68247 RepID=A0ABW7BYL0_9ACTN
MPAQISLHDVTVSRGERILLDRVSLSVRPGERIGIVGENGAGKSTLLHLLAGTAAPDDGRAVTPADESLRLLRQTPELPPGDTVADAVDSALAEFRGMEARLRALETRLDGAPADDLAAYGELLTAYELRGGYEADARVDKVLHALGIAHIARDRRLGSLSGGEQARLGIACAVAAAPEVLLLDEPTNHLDEAALDWLEESLRNHRGTVVAVSHDRVFLERVTTALVEVDADRRALVRHGEGYAGFRAAREAARLRRRQEFGEWQAETERLEAYAEGAARAVAVGRGMKDNNKMAYDRAGGRVQASVSGRVRSVRERLRRLRADPVPEPAPPLAFAARPEAGTAHGELIFLDRVRVGERLAVDTLTVRAGERLLIHGGNGAGKSTLLLLDEPANHLALGLVEELERALEEWPGAVVVVSHDRELRRRFTGRTCRMDAGRLPD